MFKALTLYRIGPAWAEHIGFVAAALDEDEFAPCAPSQEKSSGWVPPRGEEHGAFVESIDGQWIMRHMSEAKSVPASVVKRKLDERCAKIEASTGRKPGKKERRELAEDVRRELLPNAFARRRSTFVWIDSKARIMAIGTGSPAVADEIATSLVRQLNDFCVALVNTEQSPSGAMAAWLIREAPEGFVIDRECELKATDESKAVVRYSRHTLDIKEVIDHVKAGKMPVKLALAWKERVSFVMDDHMRLKKLAFLDVPIGKDKEDAFDADVAIATGELRPMIAGLVEALGGYQGADAGDDHGL